MHTTRAGTMRDVEMACADCSCVVERGLVVRSCARYPGCCCQDVAVSENSGTSSNQ